MTVIFSSYCLLSVNYNYLPGVFRSHKLPSKGEFEGSQHQFLAESFCFELYFFQMLDPKTILHRNVAFHISRTFHLIPPLAYYTRQNLDPGGQW